VSAKAQGQVKVGADDIMTNSTNNRSKLFVNDADDENSKPEHDTLASRSNAETDDSELKIKLFRKIKIELNAA
jgi:hypothetical protein